MLSNEDYEKVNYLCYENNFHNCFKIYLLRFNAKYNFSTFTKEEMNPSSI